MPRYDIAPGALGVAAFIEFGPPAQLLDVQVVGARQAPCAPIYS